ncbi:hypothetical protein V3C99_019204, partial [Haemonchus contortus]
VKRIAVQLREFRQPPSKSVRVFWAFFLLLPSICTTKHVIFRKRFSGCAIREHN